ncbi:hypothetical protein OBBRIDRAFT_128848 [Obba rivulosa]|uniref:Uncharacterized protein n=1 Tax=Obba rivulosa TaxID=1052685 RepID=A0A8E2DIB9_9APHY|nr:hypothetical protein OBBRIDRAFT_128848 [Obba rivulosa]
MSPLGLVARVLRRNVAAEFCDLRVHGEKYRSPRRGTANESRRNSQAADPRHRIYLYSGTMMVHPTEHVRILSSPLHITSQMARAIFPHSATCLPHSKRPGQCALHPITAPGRAAIAPAALRTLLPRSACFDLPSGSARFAPQEWRASAQQNSPRALFENHHTRTSHPRRPRRCPLGASVWAWGTLPRAAQT